MLSAYREPLDFELPALGEAHRWKRWLDTALPSPDDIRGWRTTREVLEATYLVEPRSVVVLFACTV